MVEFCEETLDDLMHGALEALVLNGQLTRPSRGDALELRGVRLELTNPRARLSRSYSRGRVFSCLGELVWYLAGSDSVEHIAHYLSRYRDDAEPDGTVHAAYGTRLFAPEARLQRAIETLDAKQDSRQAVVSLLDVEDMNGTWRHVPCTSTLQFFRRDRLLDMVVHMRSNDAYLGLPHDVFAFTMIQELVARSLDLRLGTYIHMVGSLHLYSEHQDRAEAFLGEGFASVTPMPAMPEGDPWHSVDTLVAAEQTIREGGSIDPDESLAPYWADLLRLLIVYTAYRSEGDQSPAIARARRSMSEDTYDVYLNDKFEPERS